MVSSLWRVVCMEQDGRQSWTGKKKVPVKDEECPWYFPGLLPDPSKWPLVYRNSEQSQK